MTKFVYCSSFGVAAVFTSARLNTLFGASRFRSYCPFSVYMTSCWNSLSLFVSASSTCASFGALCCASCRNIYRPFSKIMGLYINLVAAIGTKIPMVCLVEMPLFIRNMTGSRNFCSLFIAADFARANLFTRSKFTRLCYRDPLSKSMGCFIYLSLAVLAYMPVISCVVRLLI